ncbi:MAG: 1-phosphofructokinase family hexose kinase [Beutenbergiaceae bacterium]
MIVTVTASPAVDWTVTVDEFALDAVNRVTNTVREASGKGLNVSWALHRAGVATKAIFPGGGDTGRFLADTLETAGLPYAHIQTPEEVRTNISLLSPGHATKINEPGRPLAAHHIAQLTEAVVAAADAARLVVLCGSLPPGMDPSYPRSVVARLHGLVPVAIDTSGLPLELVLEAQPALIKPNVHELAELVECEIVTLGDAVAAAREAIRRGAQAVLASLGADGAIYVDARQALIASARDIPFANSVGAGDALLAGFVAFEASPRQRLRNAVLWASSAVAHHSTLFPIREDFADRIAVDVLGDPDLRLSEPSASLRPTRVIER